MTFLLCLAWRASLLLPSSGRPLLTTILEKMIMAESIVLNSNANNQPTDPPPDPFDLESLKLSQDFASTIGVKKVLTTVPCRKPNRHEFVRVRPGADWHLETGIFEDKIQREMYLVGRDMWGELAGEITPVCLFTTITKQGDISLWPVKLPGTDGKTNSWNESALAASQLATKKWARVASNMNAGYYDTFEATGELSEPKWPELSLQEIVKLCFKDRLIDSVDHPVLRALRGEV